MVSEPVVKNGNERLPVSVLVVYSVLVSSAFGGGGFFHLGLVLFVFFGFWFAASLLGCLWIHFQSFSISTLRDTYNFKIAFQFLFQPAVQLPTAALRGRGRVGSGRMVK